MRSWATRIPVVGALLYLLLPNLLFLLGWVEPWLSIPLCMALIVAVFTFIRRLPALRYKCEKKDLLFLFLLLIGCLFAVESLGINGHAQQSGDFIVRNAIYDSLVREDWPLYSERGEYFVYYAAYWLPPALLSKWLGAACSAALLWLWTTLGFALGFALLYSRFKRATLLLMGILFLTGPIATWGELPYILKELSEKIPALTPCVAPAYSLLGSLNAGFNYVSFWNQIAFNSFNSALPFFVFIALLMASRPKPTEAFSSAALMVSTSPLIAVVTFPYLIANQWNRRKFFQLTDLVRLAPFLLLLGCVACYFSCGNGGTAACLFSDLPEVTGELSHPAKRFARYVLIMHLMIIPTFFLLRKQFKRTAAYKYSVLLIALLPLVWIGRWNNELLIKGSTLLFFLLSVMYALLIRYGKGLRRTAAIIFLSLTTIMFFWDMAARFLHYYSWNPARMEQNIRSSWNGHLNHPDHRWYRNFWGARNSSVLKP